MHRISTLRRAAIALAGALAILPASAGALPSYGTRVDDYCTQNQRTPAAPYSGDCTICHSPASSAQGQTALFAEYKSGNLDAFCPFVPANQPPVIQKIGSQTVQEEALLDVAVVAMDPDGDAIDLQASNLPTGAVFTDQGSGIGQLLWMPTFEQAGNYSVTVKATDRGTPASSASETFTITVGNVNRPPVLAAIGPRSANPGEALAIPLSATDPDKNKLRFGAAGLPGTAKLTDHGDGTASLDWTPDPSDAGNHPVTVTVTDDGTPIQSDSEQFSIAVGSVNQPPVLDFIGDRTTGLGEPWTIGLTATDPEQTLLHFACAGSPPAAELVDNGDGSAVLSGPGEPAGNYTLTCTVTDAGSPSAEDQETFRLTIGSVNRPPVLDPIGASLEGDVIALRVTAHDPDGDGIDLTADGLPTGAVFVDHGDGTGECTWQPPADMTGDFPVVFTATDRSDPSLYATAEFTIHLTGTPTATPPEVWRARWRARRDRLAVAGGGVAPGAQVEVLDAASGAPIAEVTANRYGRFRARMSLDDSEVPCAVAARVGGLAGEAKAVEPAPPQCRTVASSPEPRATAAPESRPRRHEQEESED